MPMDSGDPGWNDTESQLEPKVAQLMPKKNWKLVLGCQQDEANKE